MDSSPVSCNFVGNSKMTKPKRIIEEAREIKNPELDLVEKGIQVFEELPGLCKQKIMHKNFHFMVLFR